ncbi:MAG: glycosyltransferase family 2 protein [Ignavibacteria bacterium]|nr:glycosyltransferase family 2 protein [Ignavibacteria bacterium]
MPTLPLSVALISFNEEANIGRTLQSILRIASEIIVVDSHSIDSTCEIAEQYGAKVFIEDWKGFGQQKQSALDKCANDWILFLDCDEVVSSELLQSISNAISGEINSFKLKRKTYYCGKLLEHTWQPDEQLRLVHKSSNPVWKNNIHEYLYVDAKVETLQGFLIHYTYKNIEDHFLKTITYAQLSAVEYHRKGRKAHWYNLIINPIIGFIKRYVIELGFLDVIRGFAVAVSAFLYFFLKYLFLWEITNSSKNYDGN